MATTENQTEALRTLLDRGSVVIPIETVRRYLDGSVIVPIETLRTLLDGWATLTSDPGRGFTKARLEVTDDAYDALRDLLPPEAVYCPVCTSDDVNRTDPAYFLRHGEICSDAFHDGADGG